THQGLVQELGKYSCHGYCGLVMWYQHKHGNKQKTSDVIPNLYMSAFSECDIHKAPESWQFMSRISLHFHNSTRRLMYDIVVLQLPMRGKASHMESKKKQLEVNRNWNQEQNA
ncbi:hypothetical protein HispidOSU_006722, partial [Sigmodon hispidus]